MSSISIGRRGLLGGLAGAGALAATGALTAVPGVASAGTTSGNLPSTVDAVVVGAGISGLVAARQIARAGRSVLVLEARDRVGGRVLNHTLANGSVIESGGAFVGPTQDHILALAADLGVQTFKEYAQGDNVYISGSTTIRYTGTVPPDPTILPDAAKLQLQLDTLSKQVPVDAPWTAANAAEWDAKSLDNWIKENTVNPATANLLLSYLQPDVGADPREISLL
ncbi:MAG: amine oxidase, partial [Streptosporangiaceae bacterium]|nr:amine oxidase [Streptosporangiaceae bacterium]